MADEHTGSRRFVDWGEWTLSFWEGASRENPRIKRSQCKAIVYFDERFGGANTASPSYQMYLDMQRRWIRERILPGTRYHTMEQVLDRWLRTSLNQTQPPEDPHVA